MLSTLPSGPPEKQAKKRAAPKIAKLKARARSRVGRPSSLFSAIKKIDEESLPKKKPSASKPPKRLVYILQEEEEKSLIRGLALTF
jgi:hypothetical protein